MHGGGGAALRDRFVAALAAQSEMCPDVRTGLGDLEPGWVTAGSLFTSDTAIDEYLDYEGSFHAAADRKTCAAAMMVDYCYIVSIATVPLFVGFGIVPDLSPSLFALKFYIAPTEHDGRLLEVRRAHVRFLSAAFSEAGACNEALRPAEQPDLDLCEIYRRAIEAHFEPLVTKLHARTGLSRSALWRLVADAIAGRFLETGRQFGRLQQAQAAAMAILKQPGSPLRNRQLHYFDLTLRDGERELLSWTFRGRGGCCRFYTVDGGELCSTCVLKPAAERDAELLDAMARHIGHRPATET